MNRRLRRNDFLRLGWRGRGNEEQGREREAGCESENVRARARAREAEGEGKGGEWPSLSGALDFLEPGRGLGGDLQEAILLADVDPRLEDHHRALQVLISLGAILQLRDVAPA